MEQKSNVQYRAEKLYKNSRDFARAGRHTFAGMAGGDPADAASEGVAPLPPLVANALQLLCYNEIHWSVYRNKDGILKPKTL